MISSYTNTMKRKLEEDPDADPPRPIKRLSMLHNTPKQWKEQRRKILNISKQKLKAIDDVDSDLWRSVLINNTYRKMKRELKQNGCSPPSTWVPKPVFASARGRALMSQIEWEREREVVAMEIQADDIKSKVLCPPLTDLSQVLSDILGENVGHSMNTRNTSEQDVIEKLCNEKEGEAVQKCYKEESGCTQCEGTLSAGGAVESESDICDMAGVGGGGSGASVDDDDGDDSSEVVNNTTTEKQQGDVNSIKCVQQTEITNFDTGLGHSDDEKSIAIDSGISATAASNMTITTTSQSGGVINDILEHKSVCQSEVSTSYTTATMASDKEMTTNSTTSNCVEEENEAIEGLGGGHVVNCVLDPQGQGEAMDCCGENELMQQSNNDSSLTMNGNDKVVTTDCDAEDNNRLTTNAIEDFVISPRGLDWSQRLMAKDSLVYLGNLPHFTCPSLITSKHELPEFSSSTASLHTTQTEFCHIHNTTGSKSNPSHQNQPTNNHHHHHQDCCSSSNQLSATTSLELPEKDGLHLNERMDISCSLMPGNSDFLQPPQCSNNHKDNKLCIRDSLVNSLDTEGPSAANSNNCDLDINQHIWACFQQFNMAIACS